MGNKFSITTALIIVSMAIEYIAIDTVKIYLALDSLAQDNGPFLVMLIPALALVGPVMLGPIVGVFTDRISIRWYIAPLIAVALWAPLAILQADYYPTEWRLLVLVVLSVLAYLSANVRIASSKYLVPSAEYTAYHASVVWIMQAVPIVAPLAAGLLENDGSGTISSWSGGTSILLCGVLLFGIALSRGTGEAVKKKESRAKRQSIPETLLAAFSFITNDRELAHSVIVVALVNVIVFVSGYAGLAAFNEYSLGAFASDNLLPGTPLIAMGAGALLGSLIAGKVKQKYIATKALSFTMSASIVLMMVQALLISSVFSLAAIACIGVLGSITVVLAWDIRLQRSRPENIGTIAGVTGAAYKIPSLVMLPVVGSLAANTGIQTACMATACILGALYYVSCQTRILRSPGGSGTR
ncbi:MFS transporter (plasmid) [Nitratireductor sp. GISD-1A_MAKvit]|uniref:MFS transporter n=1 Tax=Nitratireductor sp. GISD-1A_MAKvit TaxID=3234198 RepID=UPI00346510A9